jgi:hypothetical protein
MNKLTSWLYAASAFGMLAGCMLGMGLALWQRLFGR